MNEIPERFLPVGTVVVLKGGLKTAAITGFCSIEAGKDKMWDYSGCLFPEGFLSSNQTLLFDHDQIETIHHMGLVNEEEIAFKKKIVEFAQNREAGSDGTSAVQTPTLNNASVQAPPIVPNPLPDNN